MTYNPPIPQILLAMQAAGQLAARHDAGLSLEDVQAILSEAGRFASKRIAPLNPVGDRTPSTLDESGTVTTPPGWRETYRAWCEAGWNSLTGPAEYGGQGLPIALAVACTEFWNSSCMAFRALPALDRGRYRGCLRACFRGSQGTLSTQARIRRMDRNHELDRTAGWFRSLESSLQRPTGWRRQLPHRGQQNLRYLRRA